MGQNKRPRWKPTSLWSTNLLQGSQKYNTMRGKDNLFNRLLGKFDIHMQKNETGYAKPTKIRFKPKPIIWNHKIPRGVEYEERAPWCRSWQWLFGHDTQRRMQQNWKLTNGIKEKTKNILHDTSNNQQNIRQCTEWENMSVNHMSNNWFYPKYIRDSNNSIANKQIIQFKKWKEALNGYFSKEEVNSFPHIKNLKLHIKKKP